MKLTFGSLFAGIGGFDLGLIRTGITPTFAVEIDKQCNSVRRRHWPNEEQHTDVTTFSIRSTTHRPAFICGGFPCQDLSVAGKRTGLAGKRSGLFFEFMRIVSEFTPRWVLIENVPGLLSSNNGKDMGTVLRTLAELGYGTAYRVLDSQWFGVPQRRRRVFIVGCLGDWRRAAEVLFEPESLPWDSPPSREAGARTTSSLTSSLGSGGPDAAHACAGWMIPEVASTLRSASNSPAAHGKQNGTDRETLVAHTLRAEVFDASEDGTGRGTPIVPIAFQSKQSASAQGPSFDEVSPTLDVAKGGGMAVAYQCHGSNVGPMGTLRQGNAGTTGGVPFVTTFAQNSRDEVREIGGNISGELSAQPGMKQQTYLQQDMAVRRLTPTECERLQSFPDGWTRYRDDRTEIADGPRYRMLGNAVTVNVAEWIGRRIMEACE